MYRLYDYLPSGNSYKARLLMALLDQKFERIDVDIIKGESRTAEFLARNPNGRIPALELPGGEIVWESGAILDYLGAGSRFVPTDRLAHARMLQWMFFEQYSHEPFIAVLRFWRMHKTERELATLDVDGKLRGGIAALEVMEGHLRQQAFFVAGQPTLADIALYGYTHVADEGGFDLNAFPAVGDWMQRIAALPGYVPITAR